VNADSFVVRALGRRVAVTLDPALADAARRVWHLCLDDTDGPHDADVDHPAPASTEADAVASSLQDLTQRVTRAAIGAAAGRSLMFHAGALCDPLTGAALVYVAPGGTGKTTATRTLGPGRGYITDETVAVRPDLTIEPYSKPLSVRRSASSALKDERAPGDLGLVPPAVTPWLAGIVALRRDRPAGAGIEVEDVPLLDALVTLAPETSSLARLGRPLRRLADAVEAAGGLRVVRYAEACDLEPVVAEVLGRTR
jgi:hypothetical protein